MSDPATCDHEWVDDGTLEVFPPIATSHCRKCGLKRHVKIGSGQTTYLQPSESSDRHGSVSNRPADKARTD